ncbi:D-serine ammonia-lyase, partial [Pseudomonas aeruginosa]|nr:D-serine ammonia-lyase [Pseudomonas aeruginosa]
ERLRGQLDAAGIRVDSEHPLFVHLPCGVGGGPGGVAFGLKLAFGDAVHCLFAEPTHSPCMFLGVYTGRHEQVSVQDFGIDNHTAADGLAVGRPSGFVGRAMQRLLDGYYTVDDDELFRLLALLERSQGIRLEPSALAGAPGIARVTREPQGYRERMGLTSARLALEHGLVGLDDDYSRLAEADCRAFFARHRIAVGSTGNLGLSIGIIGAALGFQASVHMSADARQWKKDKLRAHGVTVVEYASDYSVAVEQGRREAAGEPYTHFVDDENSRDLFLGY